MYMKDHYKLEKLHTYAYIYMYVCLLLLPLHFSCTEWKELRGCL